eukprot:gene27381-34088_t
MCPKHLEISSITHLHPDIISLQDLYRCVIKKHSLCDPLIEDRGVLHRSDKLRLAEKLQDNKDLKEFFHQLRLKVDSLIHEGRSPAYILQNTNKMTTPQAVLFFKQKLAFDVSKLDFCSIEKLFSELLKDYYSGSSGVLIDVKRVLLE